MIQAFDPAISSLPDAFSQFITLHATAEDALQDAEALIVYTGWPEFKSIDGSVLMRRMNNPLVLDANRFLAEELDAFEGIRYLTVGRGD